jgi:type III restriction enzyme
MLAICVLIYNKIALIADEAHHINASTKKQTELFDKDGNPKASWENTVEKIFKAHQDNILLELMLISSPDE